MRPLTIVELYEELAGIERRAAWLELRRTEVVAGLVHAQAEADLSRDLPAGEQPSSTRRAEAREAAAAVVVDSAVAACGGRRGPWLERAEFAGAPEQLARPLRDAVDAGVLAFEQVSAVLHGTAGLGCPSTSVPSWLLRSSATPTAPANAPALP